MRIFLSLPDFCAATAQKSGNMEEMPASLPTLGSDGAGDLTASKTYASTLDSH
ncbi:MAG: hypothetical protein KDE26_15235 [Bacteroidetes bacterium]|nr:hypothetical protein [Bacteroidota bacterium]